MNQYQQTSPSTISEAGLTRSNRIAFVSSAWHHEIVHRARDAFLRELEPQGVAALQIEQLQVPGAFELPLAAKKLASSGRYAAIVACGFVVDGGIYRHEFVASAVIDGLMHVQLETGVPVLSAVLTPHQFHDSEEHRRFFADHFEVKGREVARACLQTMQLSRRLDEAASR